MQIRWDYKLHIAGTKGWLAYEYNPLHNLVKGDKIDDFITDKLKFSINHPVDIIPLTSYDGSVNLVLNDGYNKPRLINTRFTVRENNKYEVIDREGNADTNLYDNNMLEQDISLFKRVELIPKILFNRVTNTGKLPVGNYTVYIKFADEDGNETDFVAESGMISCFVGTDRDPYTIHGGYRDMNSMKAINLLVTNIDPIYDYVIVYYTRATSDVDGNTVYKATKITERYKITDKLCDVNITGFEESVPVDLTEIDREFFIASSAKAQATCLNRLFLGNVTKPDMFSSDLEDLSLRFSITLRKLSAKSLIGVLDHMYMDDNSTYGYYNSLNLYNYVGYRNHEMYRFGIVYIYEDNLLSSVYNLAGGTIDDDVPENDKSPTLGPVANSIYRAGSNAESITDLDELMDCREYLLKNTDNFTINLTERNYKGVVFLDLNNVQDLCVYGFEFTMPDEVKSYLKKLGIKGYFFVRQRCIPRILCQFYSLALDPVSYTPLIHTPENGKTKYYYQSFIGNNRMLSNYRPDTWRASEAPNIATYKARACICPDYDTHIALLNNFFTGAKYTIKLAELQPKTSDLTLYPGYPNSYYFSDLKANTSTLVYNNVALAGVQDGDLTPLVVINNQPFRAKAGEPTEATKFEYVGIDKKLALTSIATSSKGKADEGIKEATNLIRGMFGPYVGAQGAALPIGKIYDVYAPETNGTLASQFHIRYVDKSAFQAVSERYGIDEKPNVVYRGDCYICNFTHRVHRNFSDPDAPTNETIVKHDTWKEGYDPGGTSDINVGDLNAVQLGTWITGTFISHYNLSLRSTDLSYPSEEGIYGHPRGFYPLQEMSVAGNYKIAESNVMNAGISSSTPYKHYFVQADLPYRKNTYQTRILYSKVAAADNFLNGFRVFKSTDYQDYPSTYGGILKLVEIEGSLLCVFEHGIGLIPVNERTVAGKGAGGDVFINTDNILPLNPLMVSDKYGTQWPDSVIKTPSGIYGVDTVAKKIWRCTGKGIEIISDFKVLKFLNDNITLDERDLVPIIGIRDVKTHYNAFKEDVMFTFYDNVFGNEETVWNLCWNERLGKWITFYSWVPSYSENINNIFFSFNRDTSKWIGKLWMNLAGSNNVYTTVHTESGEKNNADYDETLHLNINKTLEPGVSFSYDVELMPDPYGFYRHFTASNNTLTCTNTTAVQAILKEFRMPVCLLNVHVNLSATKSGSELSMSEALQSWSSTVAAYSYLYYGQVALQVDSAILSALGISDTNTSAFWKHGQAGLMKHDVIKPTKWYGKQHPFEFEFVVNGEEVGLLKIWNNLNIISNKAKPESFHYEVVGECYDFSPDKANIYYRQEALKQLFQVMGSNILYDRNFKDLIVELDIDGIITELKVPYQVKTYTSDLSGNKEISTVNRKATLFPLTYTRYDTVNEIEDTYKYYNSVYEGWKKYGDLSRDYKHLAGTEIIHDPQLNEFKLQVHSPGRTLTEAGRLKGNMQYLEDKWDILIAPIIHIQKNEPNWKRIYRGKDDESFKLVTDDAPQEDSFIDLGKRPPLVIRGALPNDIGTTDVSALLLVDCGFDGSVDVELPTLTMLPWTGWSGRRETRLRDKYIRIKVRYSGRELAIIHSIMTLYTLSYA